MTLVRFAQPHRAKHKHVTPGLVPGAQGNMHSRP
jgi:hypothetical protein